MKTEIPSSIRTRAEQLIAGITPGEWVVAEHNIYTADICAANQEGRLLAGVSLVRPEGVANAEFIAAAPQLVRDLLSLVASPSEKCDGHHGGPRCADPECWNDDPSEPTATFEDGWRAGLAHARDVFRRHDWQGQLEEILAVVDAVHEREP